VPEVIGNMGLGTVERLSKEVTQACGNLDKEATITVVDFATRPDDAWQAIDDRLAKAIEHAAAGGDYTILLLSSSVEPVYEASFDMPAQMELKRGAQHLQRRKDNGTNWDELPLFEKYQFFIRHFYGCHRCNYLACDPWCWFARLVESGGSIRRI